MTVTYNAEGLRFDEEANLTYKVPWDKVPKQVFVNSATSEEKEIIDINHSDTLKTISKFIQHHKEKQLPRLKELDRYSEGLTNILFREKKKNPNKADNRVPSDYVSFVTTFNRGVIVGNPVQIIGEDSNLTKEIEEFSKRSDLNYHNQNLCDMLFNLGRAYELLFRHNGEDYVALMNPMNTFVVYDNNKKTSSVFGINYYVTEYLEEKFYYVDVYTPIGIMYTLEAKADDYQEFKEGYETTHTFFDGVQINEYQNNEKRLGDAEKVLPVIDVYDLSQSELANYQENTNNAILVISGNPQTGKGKTGSGNSPEDVAAGMKESGLLILGQSPRDLNGKPTGETPQAYYLISEYDSVGAESYKARLVSDILRFTMVIDFTDVNMGGNNTGVGLMFKSWGNNNLRKTKERLLEKGFMRRLRILGSSYSRRSKSNPELIYDEINNLSIKFTPNIPQSDEEIMNVVKGLFGIVSKQTSYQMAEKLTGVQPDDEEERIASERDEAMKNMPLFSQIPDKEVDVDEPRLDKSKQETGSTVGSQAGENLQ